MTGRAEAAAEALASLAPAFRMSNGRSTRTDGLKGCELAGAMKGLTEAQAKLLFAKYISGSFSGAQSPEFYKLFMGATVDIATHCGWDLSEHPGLLRRMTVVAIGEVINPQVCRTCSGTRYVASRLCQPCNGSGHRPLSERAKAELCEVSKTTWARTWANRYERVYRRIADMEGDALRSVWAQMRQG